MNRFDFLTNDKCVGRIFTTTNYAKFRLDELNRPLDAKHANNLYEWLFYYPLTRNCFLFTEFGAKAIISTFLKC